MKALQLVTPPEVSETATCYVASVIAAHPMFFVFVSVVLYMQTLGVRTDYFQISPQRSDQLHDQFSCQVRTEKEILSSFYFPDAAVAKGLRCKCSF